MKPRPPKKPSPRMIQIAAFVEQFTERYGFPPSTTDMSRGLRLERSWCFRIASEAAARGALVYDPGVARSWRVPGPTIDTKSIGRGRRG